LQAQTERMVLMALTASRELLELQDQPARLV